MSKAGTSGKKSNFEYSGKVDENTFKNEKFPELEDANYPQQLIAKLKGNADAAEKKQKELHAITPGDTERKAHYQYRGPAYVHKHGGRGHYNLWPFDYLFNGCDDAQKKMMLEKVESLAQGSSVWAAVKDKSKWKERYEFPEPGSFPGKEKRFFLGAKFTNKKNAEHYYFRSTGSPYSWAAHHLIPIGLFSSNNKRGSPFFTDKELEQIRLSGYDVNNGHNVVPVPTEETAPHCLLVHGGSHPEYNKLAAKKMDKVKDKVAEAVEEKTKPHAAFYPDLIRRLTDAEEALWKELIRVGEDTVRLFLQGKSPRSVLVKLLNKTGNKKAGARKAFPIGAMA